MKKNIILFGWGRAALLFQSVTGSGRFHYQILITKTSAPHAPCTPPTITAGVTQCYYIQNKVTLNTVCILKNHICYLCSNGVKL